jgi:hypothetical protein
MTRNPQAAAAQETGESACIERRSAMRYECNLEITCRAIDSGQEGPWTGRILDLSSVGLGLLLPMPLDRGTILLLDLPVLAAGAVESLIACVMHTRPHEDGGIFTGCVFAEPLSEAEVAVLLERSHS